ncbi:MAG: hypothetical protein DRN92_03970, partial [Thermoproteota archaeon]
GYYRRKIYLVDLKLKKEMLRKSIIIKEMLWEILQMPKRMQRGVEYFHKALQARKIAEEDYRVLARAIEEQIPE